MRRCLKKPVSCDTSGPQICSEKYCGPPRGLSPFVLPRCPGSTHPLSPPIPPRHPRRHLLAPAPRRPLYTRPSKISDAAPAAASLDFSFSSSALKNSGASTRTHWLGLRGSRSYGILGWGATLSGWDYLVLKAGTRGRRRRSSARAARAPAKLGQHVWG